MDSHRALGSWTYTDGSSLLKPLIVTSKFWLYPLITYTYTGRHFKKVMYPTSRMIVGIQLQKLFSDPRKRSFHAHLLRGFHLFQAQSEMDHAAFIGSAMLVSQYFHSKSERLSFGHEVRVALQTAAKQRQSHAVKAILDLVDLTSASSHDLVQLADREDCMDEVKGLTTNLCEALGKLVQDQDSKSRLQNVVNWLKSKPGSLQSTSHHFRDLNLSELQGYIRLLDASMRGDAPLISNPLKR
ncbi:hypothetical protein IWX49DRAFT_555856 [Phyllosticta citricarpa]